MAGINKEIKSYSGKVECSRSILLSIISLATREINGVAAMVDTASMKFKKIFNRNESKGVKVKLINNFLLVDIYIKIKHGHNVPDIAYKIQENIKNSITAMVDLSVSKINVHIVGVEFNI